jgi:RNA polymerase sigma factor (sigma-70 family)
MQPRTALTDIFSTFLQWEADVFHGWATDARLRRSMQGCLAQNAETPETERFWERYWHHRSLTHSQTPPLAAPPTASNLPVAHLSAYLQEACYWSVRKVTMRLDSPQSRLADCFQVAIADVPKILKVCDPNQGASLKTYASQAFGNIVRDHLRQRREIDLCNDWGLLLKISRKRLGEALNHAGLGGELRDRYQLAWVCFTDIYIPQKAPGLRQLAQPDQVTWEAIAQRYNNQRHTLPAPGATCTPETLETWLKSCAKSVRAYLYPAVKSLNTPQPQTERELQDDLPDLQESLLTELIHQEELSTRQTQQTQINDALIAALASLDESAQTLLDLYYHQGLTQQQIANQLNIPQYTISRRLTKMRETLLRKLTQWSQENLHISPSSDVIKHISTLLEEWLEAKLKTH